MKETATRSGKLTTAGKCRRQMEVQWFRIGVVAKLNWVPSFSSANPATLSALAAMERVNIRIVCKIGQVFIRETLLVNGCGRTSY